MLLCCYMKEEPPGEAHRPAAGRAGNTPGEYWLTAPKELAECGGGSRVTLMEVRRVGRHVELRRREDAGGDP